MMSCLHKEKGVKLPKKKKKKKKQRPLWTTYLLTNYKTEERKKDKIVLPPLQKKNKKQWSVRFNESQRCVRAYRTQMTLFLFHVWALRRCGIWRTEVLISSVYSLEQNILLWKYRNTVRYTAVSVSYSLTKQKEQNKGCCPSSKHIFNILCHAALEKHLSFYDKINGSRFMELKRECSDTLAVLWGCIPPRRSSALS